MYAREKDAPKWRPEKATSASLQKTTESDVEHRAMNKEPTALLHRICSCRHERARIFPEQKTISVLLEKISERDNEQQRDSTCPGLCSNVECILSESVFIKESKINVYGARFMFSL